MNYRMMQGCSSHEHRHTHAIIRTNATRTTPHAKRCAHNVTHTQRCAHNVTHTHNDARTTSHAQHHTHVVQRVQLMNVATVMASGRDSVFFVSITLFIDASGPENITITTPVPNHPIVWIAVAVSRAMAAAVTPAHDSATPPRCMGIVPGSQSAPLGAYLAKIAVNAAPSTNAGMFGSPASRGYRPRKGDEFARQLQHRCTGMAVAHLHGCTGVAEMTRQGRAVGGMGRGWGWSLGSCTLTWMHGAW
jgi:hypothetical protein